MIIAIIAADLILRVEYSVIAIPDRIYVTLPPLTQSGCLPTNSVSASKAAGDYLCCDAKQMRIPPGPSIDVEDLPNTPNTCRPWARTFSLRRTAVFHLLL